MYKPPTPEMLAYLDFSVSTTGILAGVKVCRCPFKVSSVHSRGSSLNAKMPSFTLSMCSSVSSLIRVFVSRLCFRCLTLPPVPCVAPLNSSVNSTPHGRSPSVWTPTAAWVLPSGACAGKLEAQNKFILGKIEACFVIRV